MSTPMNDEDLRKVVTQAYRAAKHEAATDGYNMQVIPNLLGPALFRARVAELVLHEITRLAGLTLAKDQLISALAMFGNMLASDTDFQQKA